MSIALMLNHKYKKEMPFQITQFLDVGTSNPIVARLGVGLKDIVEMAQIDSDKKSSINASCFKIMKSLVEAEKQAKPLMDEIKEIEQKIAKEGVKIQPNGMAIETPGIIKLDNAKPCLMFFKEALQTLANVMGVIMDKTYNGPHFHKIRDDAKGFFGEDHIVPKLLQEDQQWIKEILKLRDEIEHPKSSKPFAKGYNIERQQDEKFLVSFPRFFDDTDILNRLEVYSHNLLTFSEEIVAHSMTKFFPPQAALYEIPSEQRDTKLPVRYRVGLSESARKAFEGNI